MPIDLTNRTNLWIASLTAAVTLFEIEGESRDLIEIARDLYDAGIVAINEYEE